jgi:hypothetical protein
MQELLGAMAGHQAAMDTFVSVVAGTASPEALFDPDLVPGLTPAT